MSLATGRGVERTLGRTLSEEDRIKILCIWAGQAGHEKCGWCKNCHKPRFTKVPDCKHPFEFIYKGWDN